MAVELRKLINPTNEELDEAARIAAQAFQDDVFTGIFLGGNWDLLFPFCKCVVQAQNIAGENVVAVADGKFVGLAGWFPPGSLFLGSPDQAEAAGWNDFVSKMTPELTDWWMKYFLPSHERLIINAFGDPGFKKDVWNLQTLCVLPEYRRRGIGRSLVKAKENEIIASSPGQAIVLESEVEENTKMYKRWGFDVQGTLHIESYIGECEMWCLYKKF
ncbi:hypothetical protein K474DRAFT_803600 [Panus rudis PR-1116 ss-1]|nr:hypothetical protein K474DRAFT_803600 [Panus rudis PR-1116 ss-1]